MSIKSTFTLLFFIAFTATAVEAQTNWVKQPLDERMAIKFPATPNKLTRGASIAYKYTDKDSLIYSAATVDFEAIAQLDSAKLATMKDKPEFAEGIKAGLTKTAKNYEWGNVILGKWKGYSSYSVAGVNAIKKTKIYFLIVLLGSKGYYLSCVVPDAASSKSKDDYFSTIELIH